MQDYSAPKAMKQVGSLFERYKKRFVAPQASVEKMCAEVIKEVTGFSVSEENIKYTVSTKTIALSVPSILKSELKFHHQRILTTMKDRLGDRTTPQIIF